MLWKGGFSRHGYWLCSGTFYRTSYGAPAPGGLSRRLEEMQFCNRARAYLKTGVFYFLEDCAFF